MASQLRVGVLGPVFVIIMVVQGKMREERLTLLCKVRHVDQGWGKVGGDQAGCNLGVQTGILCSLSQGWEMWNNPIQDWTGRAREAELA